MYQVILPKRNGTTADMLYNYGGTIPSNNNRPRSWPNSSGKIV